MRIPRLHVDQPLGDGIELELPEAQSHYLCRVLRMSPGRNLWVFNGLGGAYFAELVQLHAKKCRISICRFESESRESPLSIELGIGLSKGDRFDWLVQKATEFGVTEIQPLFTERAEVKLNVERAEKKSRQWRAIAVSACEQSGRNLVPAIAAPTAIEDWLNQDSAAECFILDPVQGVSFKDYSLVGQQVRLLVGPEGGLSDQEVDLAISQGYQPLSLGPRILRTESAPLAAIGALQILWGDW